MTFIKPLRAVAIAAVAFGAIAPSVVAQTATAPAAQPARPSGYGAPISQASARTAMAASLAEARRSNLQVAVAIVDGGGHLVAFERMDGAATAVIDVAIGKARTAAGFGVPTAVVAGFMTNSPALLSVDGVVPIRGAVPIVVGGKVIGAIGVSGAPSAEDERIAMAGAATVRE